MDSSSSEPPPAITEKSRENWLAVSLIVPGAIGLALGELSTYADAFSVGADNFVPWALAAVLALAVLGVRKLPLRADNVLHVSIGLSIAITYAWMFAFPTVLNHENTLHVTWRILIAPLLVVVNLAVLPFLARPAKAGPMRQSEWIVCTLLAAVSIAACIPRARVVGAHRLYPESFGHIDLWADAPPGTYWFAHIQDDPRPYMAGTRRCIPAYPRDPGSRPICIVCEGAPNSCFAVVSGRQTVQANFGPRVDPYWDEHTVLWWKRSPRGELLIEIGEQRGLFRVDDQGWVHRMHSNNWNRITVCGVPWSWIAFAALCVLAAWLLRRRNASWARFCFAHTLCLMVPAALANWGAF